MAVEPTRDCVGQFRKYADTVAVSAGIAHIFETNPTIGHFVGIEHKLIANKDDLLTPDITTLFDDDSRALLFDLKYSLPSDVQGVKDELLSLEKYKNARTGFGVSGTVRSVDFVLVCHMEDARRATQAAVEIYTETGNRFFSPETFSVWSWTVGVPRSDERREEMRLLHMHGASRNTKLQGMVSQTGGMLVPEEVLTALRFTQSFVREKPPVQYTMSLLIQNVLSALRPLPLSAFSERLEYAVTLETVAQKANILFPPWWESDVRTVQIKRSWIKEALETLVKVKMIGSIPAKPDSYSISTRKLVFRKQLPHIICERLAALVKRRPRGRPPGPKKIAKSEAPPKKTLLDYFP